MQKGYRIISIEAADIYKSEHEYGVAVGYKMPEIKSNAYFRLFKNYLDYSLDLIELEKAYKRICRKKFSFADEHNNLYTLSVINVKFNYTYKPEAGNYIQTKNLREYFYANGFNLDGIHYVRYKRSAGSSREGKCLFIDERLYKAMSKWSELRGNRIRLCLFLPLKALSKFLWTEYYLFRTIKARLRTKLFP